MTVSVRQSSSATGAVIYWPAGKALRGGVVCLHGTEGGFAGWNDLNCALLAANGFAAMAHSYTRNARYETHPDIDDVPLEATEAALLCMREQLAPYRFGLSRIGLGLFGVSRDAEHALLVAELLAEEASPATIDSMERSEGLRLRAQFPRFGNIRVMKLAAGDTVAAAVKRLMATGRYDYVEPDLVRRGLAVPNDPDFSSRWGLWTDQAPAAASRVLTQPKRWL